MLYRITVSTIMEAEIIVEADDADAAVEKVEEGVYADSYCNNTAGFEVKSWADESLGIEEVYTFDDVSIASVEEVE